jgi:anaerobic magnesium-protoporphyrin IX monomethyl ester cyclase
MKDITLVNLNMLYVKHFDHIERELHVPLGPLYVASALEDAGFEVDFRDYQLCDYEDPFSSLSILDFVTDPAPVLGFSVMTNLLPFLVNALRCVKERYPDRFIILGGVGPKSIETKLLARFPWLDIIAVGESERLAPLLLEALLKDQPLDDVPGIVYRRGDRIMENRRPPRIERLDEMTFPAFHRIDLRKYAGYGVITSRGCPYPCTFCSVAPIWDRRSYSRSAESIIAEMEFVNEEAGADLFLFQDEFFVSSKGRVLEFCRVLKKRGLPVLWKTFGRVDLTDEEMMKSMADAGCIEIRFGIESGSSEVLARTRKGFTPEEAVSCVTQAISIIPGVDCFYVWGFPFETMEHFYQSVFQMVSLRSMGARVLPSLLSFLPQTDIYQEYRDSPHLSFCPDLFPEYMVTGHEECRGARVTVDAGHRPIFDFIASQQDIFPGFFHFDYEGNVLPKLAVLQEFGFYPAPRDGKKETESCGAHSPRTGRRHRSGGAPRSPAAIATGAQTDHR